jgi:hypothetical protein
LYRENARFIIERGVTGITHAIVTRNFYSASTLSSARRLAGWRGADGLQCLKHSPISSGKSIHWNFPANNFDATVNHFRFAPIPLSGYGIGKRHMDIVTRFR